jgi:hypothetical protein
MNLYMNGDSNMAGTEVAKQDSIPYHVQQTLQVENVTNHALAGASNDRIYDTTWEYLKDNQPDFVLIGWSDAGRIQMLDHRTGNKIELNGLRVGGVPEEWEGMFNLLKEKMTVPSDYSRMQSFYWHYKIFNLHNYLIYRGIKHLFFSAFDIFTLWPLGSPDHFHYHLNWQNNFYKPYTTAYVPWCLQNGYKQQTEGRYHFEPRAQKAWSDLLCTHIKEHIL